MKLYRFLGQLIDLELISSIYSNIKGGDYPFVEVRVEFLLGAPPIDLRLYRGAGLGLPEDAAPVVERYRQAVQELEAAWAGCGRVIPTTVTM